MLNRSSTVPQQSTMLKVAGVLLILAAFALLLIRTNYFRDHYSLFQANRLVQQTLSESRTTEGRLFGATHGAYNPAASASENLGKAELLLLPLRRSAEGDLIQSRVDLCAGALDKAAERLQMLTSQNGGSPKFANDYGVALLELARRDRIHLFEALDQFDKAIRLAPRAPEPRFNRILVLRKLQFTRADSEETAAYSKLETRGPWHDEIVHPPLLTEDQIAAQLHAALDRHDKTSAQIVFALSPEICRTIATRYAMDPMESSEDAEIAEFVSESLKGRYHDNTLAGMLEPLDGPYRSDVIEARRLVSEGAEYYLKADYDQSMQSYSQAAERIRNSDSNFDRLWIDLNTADTEIRLKQIDEAQFRLDNVVIQSESAGMRWLLAMALTSYGANVQLNPSYSAMLQRLEEASRVFGEIDAPKSAVRANYYLAGHTESAGDLQSSLKLAVDCVTLTEANDHIRLSSLDWLLSVILYRRGFTNQAIVAGNESLVEAHRSQNPGLIIQATSSLASLTEFNQHSDEADRYLGQAQAAVNQISSMPDRQRSELTVNAHAARVLLHRQNFELAEQFLQKNIDAFKSGSFPYTFLISETWMLLGRTYAATNRIDNAREAFRKAIDVAEEDGTFLKSERFRQTYDDERRELYDSAIDFEFVHDSRDAAWTYMQKYRAKLFLEFLAQFNPSIEEVHTVAIDRDRVESLVPADLQIVEYAVLPDRLLVWVVTNHSFQARSVQVTRDSLETRVWDFLNRIRAQKPVASQSLALYGLLIGSISDLLDPGLALAIIPDRALHGLPFGALQSPGNNYLIEQYPILVSPSLTHLLAVSHTRPKRDVMIRFGSRTEEPAQNREMAAMKTIYRRIIPFAGSQVTKTSFLDALEQAPVFHYTGHSAHDASDPLRSSILLDGSEYGPNSVTAVDISSHKLQQNAVVVLSSCDSSVGNSKDGIGMRGLTSAFLIGGAGAVVGSLWPVEETSTSELMIAFHRAFAAEHLPVAQALRKAQMSFLESFPRQTHPYYWSGFVVTGNYSALQ